MTERDVYASIAACLRNQAEQQRKVNPAYARELLRRAAQHAAKALSPGKCAEVADLLEDRRGMR
jgi:hypothetical protein